MIRTLLCALLLTATFAFAQQQPQGQGQNPPNATPPAPDNRPQSQQPPATAPQQQQSPMANTDVQSQIQNVLGNDPSLSGVQVQASVDDQSITLTGTVDSQAQKDRAMALVSPYMGQRKIVDKIKVK